jgi:hypothetical protein
MASPGAIASSRLGQAGKATSKIKGLRDKIEALEAAKRAAPRQIDRTVEDIIDAASRQRSAPPAPAVLSPEEMALSGPAVPPPVGPVMPPPSDDFAAILQAVGQPPEVLDGLRAKARQYQADLAAGRPAVPLSVEESLALVSAGDDPADVFGRQLTKREYDQIMRNVVKGVPISPEAAAALRRSPAGDVIEQNWQGTLTPEQQDALEASDFDLEYGGKNNLTPNEVRANPAMQVADAVRQYTTPAAMESVSVDGVKRLLETIQQDYPAGSPQRAALEQAFAGWSPNPDAPDLPPPAYAVRAMEDGRRRLAALEQMASDPNFTQEAVASAAIQRAAQSRAGGTGPRPGGSFAPTEPGLSAAASRFNELPLDVRQDIVRRLGADSPARRLVAMEGGEVSIAPNTVAELLRPANDVSDLIEQMDAAKRMGDQSTVDAVSELVRQAPEADRRAAIAQFRERMAIEAALRQGMEAVSPTPAVAASPGPTALRPQGAMTPEFAVAPPDRMPGAFEEAEAAFNQSATQRESQRPRTFNRNRDQRLQAIGKVLGKPAEGERSLGRKDGMFFKGGGERLERRADSARMVDSNDTKAIRSAREADDAWQARMAELNAAHQQALADAQAASGPELIAAMQQVEATDLARREAARQGPTPTYVNQRGDKVRADTLVATYRQNFPNANERSIRKMISDDGWDEQAIGRSAWSDARLSKAASAQTMDGIVGALLEHKPKPQVNLNRSSDMLSPGDVAAQNDEARDLLRGMIEEGDLPVELDTTEDVADRARRGRLGGGSAASRREAALQGNSTGGLFGSYNPLELKLGSDNLYASARDLAADVLEETDSYHSRTPNYETNLERLTELLEDVYGPNSRNEGLPQGTPEERASRFAKGLLDVRDPDDKTIPAGAERDPMTQDPQAVPPLVLQGRQGDPEGFDEATSYSANRRGEVLPQRAPRDFSQPETVLTPEQLAELAENEDAASIAAQLAEIKQSVTGSDVAASGNPTGADVGTGRPVDQSVEDKLNASDPSGTDIGGTPAPSGDASVNAKLDASATSLDAAAPATLSKEALDALREQRKVEYARLLEEEKASGVRDREARNNAEQRADEWFHEEVARRTASQSGAAPLPDAAGPLDPPPAQPSPAAVDADTPATGTPVESDAAAQRQADNAKDEAAKKAVTGEGTDGQQPAPGPTPRTWGQWLWRAGKIGGGLTAAGTGGLYVMQPKSGPAPIDIPPSSPVPPLPPGFLTGSGTAGDPAADEAAAIERALERIRGGRSSSTQSAPYATIQNPTMWR